MGDNFLKKKAAGLLDCKVEKAEVTDGRGLFAGIRGFIHISKENLGKVTKEEYTEFVTGTVETGSYRWFTILCGDGNTVCKARQGSIRQSERRGCCDGYSLLYNSGRRGQHNAP